MLNGLNNFPLSLELPYLTSSLGVGFSKSIQKVQNQQIYVPDRGGTKKSNNFADVIYGSPLSLLAPIYNAKEGRRRQDSIRHRREESACRGQSCQASRIFNPKLSLEFLIRVPTFWK